MALTAPEERSASSAPTAWTAGLTAGFDVTAPCGTDLEAVRGGEVERRGYDPELFGHFIEVDARWSPIDYFYAHMREPATAACGRSRQDRGKAR